MRVSYSWDLFGILGAFGIVGNNLKKCLDGCSFRELAKLVNI